MHRREASHGSKGLVLSGICLLVSCLLLHTEMASGSPLKSRIWKGTRVQNKVTVTPVRDPQPPTEIAALENSAVPAAGSSSTKLFWFDPGPFNTSANPNAPSGTLWFVDPSLSPPVPTVYETGVTVFDNEDGGNFKNHFIVTGDIDLVTYKMTNLKAGYLFYFKGGSIWLVDTGANPLSSRQLSNETHATAEALCFVNSYVDLTDSNNSVISYVLAGPDGNCWTGDELNRVVRLDSAATNPPINMGAVQLDEALFGGSYIVMDHSSVPWRARLCSSGGCTDIGNFTDHAWTAAYDNSCVLLVMDKELKKYKLPSGPLTTLYTPGLTQQVHSVSLDRDGSVYFLLLQNTTPAKNYLKKKPGAGGAVVTLASFSTPTPLTDAGEWNLELSPTYAVYSFRNPDYSSLTTRSVPKAGGAVVTLATNGVEGGLVGSCLFTENTLGQMQKVNLDGSGKITLKDAQLNGATYGGSADWYYRMDPATFRGFISTKNRNLKSYLISEDFTDPAQGVLLGTIPYNLSNPMAFFFANELLGLADKRNFQLSSGSDVIFLDAATAKSFCRLTNSNSDKIVPFGD